MKRFPLMLTKEQKRFIKLVARDTKKSGAQVVRDAINYYMSIVTVPKK